MAKEGKPPRMPSPRSEDELRLIRARADKAELEVLERRGGLIEFSLVKEHYLETAQAIKERLSTLPQACARRCAQVRDPVEIERILQEEVNAALRELSRGRGLFSGAALKDDDEAPKLRGRHKFQESGAKIPSEDGDYTPYEDQKDDDEEFNPYGD